MEAHPADVIGAVREPVLDPDDQVDDGCVRRVAQRLDHLLARRVGFVVGHGANATGDRAFRRTKSGRPSGGGRGPHTPQ
ncbi:MAG: hypothetical protein V9G04_14605 [Nocardioides sp.]